jgi:2-(1,2-epoxy-1,2-dihydrophenyl)acetyl-CoA isomerase
MSNEMDVLFDIEDHVATVTFNRPDVLNAFTSDVIRTLIERLEESADDPAVRVVVLTGAGRGFCTGGDVRAMSAGAVKRTDAEARANLRSLARATELLHRIPKPTVAAINGACAGAGLSLALGADIRVAAASAVFTSAFVRVGGSGDYGGIWLASQILGTAKARHLFMLSERIKATEAADLGLVSAVFADETFAERVADLSARLAGFAPAALAGIKSNLNLAETSEFDAYLDAESATFVNTRKTKDAQEAARAFAEKRPPVFVGE